MYKTHPPTHMYVIIKKVRLQIIHTKLQRPEPLTNQRLRSVERRHQGVHQHVQVGQENAESDGDCETKLHKEVLHVLLVLTTLKPVQTYIYYNA